MTADASTRVAVEYLARVDRSARAAGLSESLRRELQEQLGEHLDEAAAATTGDEMTAMLEAVDRLGDPEAIVREALGDVHAPAFPAASQLQMRSRGGYEVAGIVLLTIGWVFAGVGLIAGIVLVLTSKVWTASEKLAATVSAFLPLAGLSLVLLSATTTSTGTGPDGRSVTSTDPSTIWNALGAVAGILLFLAPLIVGTVLWIRAGRRDPGRRLPSPHRNLG